MTNKEPNTSKTEEINAEDLDEVVGGIDAASPYLKGERTKPGSDSSDRFANQEVSYAKGDKKPGKGKGLLGDELGVL